MAITRRQLDKTATYVLTVGDYYSGMPKGTLVKLVNDDGTDMPEFEMVMPVPDGDRACWIDLSHLAKYVEPTTVKVPIALAQAFIDAHTVDGREAAGGALRQRRDLRAALVKAMPMPPELLAAKAVLEAAGYKVEKAT